MEAINMKCSLEALVQSGRLQVASDTGKDMFDRVKHITLPFKTEMKLGETCLLYTSGGGHESSEYDPGN